VVGQINQPSWLGFAIGAVLLIVFAGIRVARSSQVRPLKLENLWIVPALYLIVAIVMFIQLPPHGAVLVACVLAVAMGVAVGWQRGRMMHISVDPRAHLLNQKASPALTLFLVALIAVRIVSRALLAHDSAISPAMLTDPLIALAFGMLSTQRLEMYFRGKKLLECGGASCRS